MIALVDKSAVCFTCSKFLSASLCYVVANSIPIFSQLNGLIGAVLSPFLSFVIPVTLLVKSGLKSTKLDVVCSVVYVLAVGGYAFGAGTYTSVVSINRASAESGGPFACDCMARQCVK